MRRFLLLAALLLPLSAPQALLVGSSAGVVGGNEEFVGPFPSWADVVASCGADPTGSADSTAAFQACFNGLSASTPTAYVPSGTYKISDITTTATASSGSTDLTLASTVGVKVGNSVQANAGIARATYVTQVPPTTSAGHITINQNTTGSLSSTTTKFSLGIHTINGAALICHAPTDTSLVWFGSSGGTMLGLAGVAYSRVNRCKFDGKGATNVANTIIDQEYNGFNFFDGYNQYADDVLTNAVNGYTCGYSGQGCANIDFLRDTFSNMTGIGLSMNNGNALGIFIWYSQFLNNVFGVGNNSVGNFLLYNNFFSGNTGADIEVINTATFGIHNNYSTGSKRFYDESGSCSPNLVGITGNTIVNPTRSDAINLASMGSGLFIDNIIKSLTSTTPVINVITTACTYDLFSLGNQFSVSSTAESNGSMGVTHSIDDVFNATLSPVAPTLPPTPSNLGRQIYETGPSGSGSACSSGSPCSIQTAVCLAATGSVDSGGVCPSGTRRADRAVVHVPAATYSISATINVPESAPILIIGDGLNSFVQWTGAAPGPLMKFAGPTKATVQEIQFTAGTTSDLLEVDNADQPGANVFIDQGNASQCNVCLFVDQLDNTHVEADGWYANYNALVGGNAGIQVIGGTQANSGNWQGGVTNIFTAGTTTLNPGYTASNGGHLFVADDFYDAGGGGGSGAAQQIVNLTGNSTFTYFGASANNRINPTMRVNNFTGTAAFVSITTAGSLCTSCVAGQFTLSGTNTAAKILGLGVMGPTIAFWNHASSGDTVELVNPLTTDPAVVPGGQGAVEIAEQGSYDPAGLIKPALAQLRSAKPAVPAATPLGITDFQGRRLFFSVTSGSNRYALHLMH